MEGAKSTDGERRLWGLPGRSRRLVTEGLRLQMGVMPPGQTLGSVGCPALRPLCPALPTGRTAQGGPSASSPTGAAPGTPPRELQPWLVRKRREEADQGLQELQCPEGSALGGSPQRRGPGHTETPLASPGSASEQQILLPRSGLKLVPLRCSL